MSFINLGLKLVGHDGAAYFRTGLDLTNPEAIRLLPPRPLRTRDGDFEEVRLPRIPLSIASSSRRIRITLAGPHGFVTIDGVVQHEASGEVTIWPASPETEPLHLVWEHAEGGRVYDVEYILLDTDTLEKAGLA